MKTSELIAALAQADTGPVRLARPMNRLAAGAAAGVLAAVLILALWLGFQPLSAALHASWFWMKAGYSLTVAAVGFLLVTRLARPGTPAGRSWLVVGALALAAIWMMAAHTSMRAPADRQAAVWLGSTWRVCPWRILALSAPIYVALTLGLRRLAPTRLAQAGAAAGLMAGGLAGAVYGLYCQENTAPFVAIWYTAGFAASALIGALLGPRLLRW
ncbi:MAG TPA: DUF1109 domain-containing protein [Caulobacteraceae bacterium]|jgi:hypothetical protein